MNNPIRPKPASGKTAPVREKHRGGTSKKAVAISASESDSMDLIVSVEDHEPHAIEAALDAERRRSQELSELAEEWRALVGELKLRQEELRALSATDKQRHSEELRALQSEIAVQEQALQGLRAERDAAIQKVRLLSVSFAATRKRMTDYIGIGSQLINQACRNFVSARDRERGQALAQWQARPRPRKRFAAVTRRRPVVSLLRRAGIGRGAILFFSGLYAAQDGPGGRNLLALARDNPAALGPHPLFDVAHYGSLTRHVGSNGAQLALHYLLAGDTEGRSPHPLFDPLWYRAQYADALRGWPLTTLEHFIMRGSFEGFDPHPLFDVSYYVAQVPELARSGRNPLAHYLAEGWRQGHDPHPLFSTNWYISQNPDVARAGMAPLLHFMLRGAAERRDPHPLFCIDYYLSANPDVAAVGSNPLIHYLQNGWREKRRPSEVFDAAWYLEHNPDVAAGDVEPLTHYITQGAWEARACAAGFDAASYLLARPELLDEGIPPLVGWVMAGKPDTAAMLAADDNRFVPATPGQPVQASAMQGGGSNLFAALRSSTHTRSADAYNWPTYIALARRFRELEQRRIEALDLKPAHKLLNFGSGELRRAAQDIRLKTSETPTVSIVIPVYNAVKYTIECLASVAQSRPRTSFEVIVIDDGSGDETQDIIPGIAGVRYIRNEENLGFLRTVNRAVAAARGDLLVILNNDVQVAANWLEPLVADLQDETIGVVAPMMLFPNGRLQEAGARLDVHGNSRMIGLFDDPALPRYNYARDVDYVSGACIAVRRDEFLAFGGFDMDFAPAYCEDCDLCFKYTSKGLRIRYQPASKIYHHLSVSSNALPGSYKMRQIRRNQQKLIERWGDAIEQTNDVRIISLYLPQFHTIPENDRWWGAGFTEWTNVHRALPNFAGHYQPHRPAELGSYDLTNPRAMERQAELAKRYGIHGFCYYYYWFSGRRVLEEPLERMLETGKPDMPFCICWANENWTRTWDGQERNVLLEQKYRREDDEAIILDLIRYMRSPNYIRVNGKPLLVVYRPQLLPDPKATAKLWREICRREGIGEIYLCFMEVFEAARSYKNPDTLGFDASIEFPPSNTSFPITPPGEIYNPEYTGSVTDYRRLVEAYLEEPVPAFTRFRGVMPSWDNTARRQDNSYVFHNASPGAFQAWLERIIEQTKDQNSAGERLVFVNAWNEWAEGAHLEPDEKFGRGWLEAVRNALDRQTLLKD